MELMILWLPAAMQFGISLIAMLAIMVAYHDSSSSYNSSYYPHKVKRDARNMKIATGGLLLSPVAVLTVPAVFLVLIFIGLRTFTQHVIHIIKEA